MKTFTVVPLNSGIAVLKNTTMKFVYILFRYSGENRQKKVIEELFTNENIKTRPCYPPQDNLMLQRIQLIKINEIIHGAKSPDDESGFLFWRSLSLPQADIKTNGRNVIYCFAVAVQSSILPSY